ncbi:MAG: aminodeoxychorismate synthase component I, partial [Planctomycetota bacterium]|nr:aminodeoxychorismate synthase component I [Planctomycetota bacterium]
RYNEFELPALAVGFYDTVVAFDHLDSRAWIISQGFPEEEPGRRRRRAEERLREVREILANARSHTPILVHGKHGKHGIYGRDGRCLSRQQLCPQHAMPSLEGLSSNFSREEYLDAVRRGIEYILAGDIFQVNLAQRLLHPATSDPVALYERLRSCNPAPFAGYFDLGEFQIASASPERFVCARDGRVESRPIKGTRPRHDDPAADRAVQEGLLGSEKDRAENVMIVDLLRNDLSRVCRADSVAVADLCRLETYQCVHHLVSSIEGRLADGCGPMDLVRAAFPGGSVTGAPKVRAMEIIAELEQTARGAYCGSLGYMGFDGAVDMNILIRTITAGRGWWQASVGGAVVAQSSPRDEYEETWHKAEGLLRAMG